MAEANSFRARTVRAHITQDDWGYWMMTLERDDGALSTLWYAGEEIGHDLDDVYHPERFGVPAGTEFRISEPTVLKRAGDPAWTKPAARTARNPFYVVQNGKRVS